MPYHPPSFWLTQTGICPPKIFLKHGGYPPPRSGSVRVGFVAPARKPVIVIRESRIEIFSKGTNLSTTNSRAMRSKLISLRDSRRGSRDVKKYFKNKMPKIKLKEAEADMSTERDCLFLSRSTCLQQLTSNRISCK